MWKPVQVFMWKLLRFSFVVGEESQHFIHHTELVYYQARKQENFSKFVNNVEKNKSLTSLF